MAEYCDNFRFQDADSDSFEFWNGLRGPAGPAGPAGAPGSSVELRGPVASTSELPASAPSSELWMVGEESPYEGYFWNGSAWIDAGQLMQGPQGEPGEDGTDGVTFTPTVSSSGVISWTNDGGLPNPESVNIKGPAGQNGTNGQDGAAAGFGTPTATVDANVGTPSVTVTASGPDTAKVFAFAFSNLKGEPGSSAGLDPYTSDPADLGAAASPGSSDKYSRGDHVHKMPSASEVGAQASITASGILKGDGSGGVSAAVEGTDYQGPLGITGATAGQYVRILSVDANGKPTGYGPGTPSGGTASTIVRVLANVGDTVTLTQGSTTMSQTLSSGTELEFEIPSLGEWVVSCGTITRTIKAQFYGEYEVDVRAIVLGISKTANSAGTTWNRTDDAVGLNATASIGTNAGSSDFDDMPIYKDIERVTIGSDIMVKIPKFYFQRYYDQESVEHIRICNREIDGFALHPAFNHNGVTQEYIYVGAYKTVTGHTSQPSQSPIVSITRAAFRTDAKAKGTGWGIIDLSAISAIQMLVMVEFANNDVQSVIGAGYTNGSARINTGSCDTVPNLTGRPAGTSNVVDVVWRGIEGFWGNVWEWFDGLNWNGGTYWICNNQADYADDTSTGYTSLGYTGGATNWSTSYIKAMGYNAAAAAYMLPTTGGGSNSSYYCDAVWSSTGWRVAGRGGSYGNGTAAGLFALAVSYAASGSDASVGSRLLYIPS